MADFGKILSLRKCKYCRGKDGKEKDVYEDSQSARDMANFIEKDRGIYLSVYKCPHDNGWHLTKNNAVSANTDRKETLFSSNDIPLKSFDGLWEYCGNEDVFEEETIIRGKKPRQKKPIVKIECKQAAQKTVTGKIMEITKNIDIEKLFKINVFSIFYAGVLKNSLDGIIDQITVYVENKANAQLESYTILVKRELMNKNKINKGNLITLNVIGKTINNSSRWYCNEIFASS